MPHIHSKSSRPATAALVLVLASLVLAACGGSSSTSTTTTATSASATTSTPGAAGIPGKVRFPAGRFLALRECLKKNGITLPKRTPGQPRAGGLLGGPTGPVLPTGVTKAQYEAVLKKCGGGVGRGGLGGVRSRLSTPEAKKALAKFAACMRENGIKIGEPNTSGKGAIFNTKGINTATAQFAAAEHKCQSDLRGAFGASPGAGSGEAPPSGSGG